MIGPESRFFGHSGANLSVKPANHKLYHIGSTAVARSVQELSLFLPDLMSKPRIRLSLSWHLGSWISAIASHA